MIFFRRLFEIRPLFVTMLQIALRGIVLAAGLGLTVGATSRADADPIITYKFEGDVGDCETDCVTGSFQVDSSHFSASGNTNISSFITNLSFTVIISGQTYTFDTASGFVAKPVFVAPDGELTDGTSLGLGASTFSGTNSNELTASLQILTVSMDGSSTLATLAGFPVSQGSGEWCNNDPNTFPPFQCVLGSPEPVPEPATLVLVAVPMLLCVWYARRPGPGSRLAPL